MSFGDPAVAVGPRPDASGHFSWGNGARVYYANLAANFGAVLQESHQGTVKGLLGVAVSRLDNPTPARVAQKSSWMPPSIVIKRSGTFSLEDKEQLWADNTYPGHDIYQERVGDYVYAAASDGYGAGVWTDARGAAVCPAVQQYRAASLAAGALALPAPWPLADCPAGFGNTDIWSASTG